MTSYLENLKTPTETTKEITQIQFIYKYNLLPSRPWHKFQ